ncbi:MAG: FG-GAP repeat protein, partial [Burkholderiales bacterium]
MRSIGPLLLGLTCLAAAAPGSAQTSFGRALIVGEGEVFVGEPANGNAFRPGRVYVYRKVAGLWKEAARLTAPKPERADGFGSGLALAGSTLFVARSDGSSIQVFDKQTNGSWKAMGAIATTGATEGPLGPMVGVGDWLFLGLPGRALGGRSGGGGRGGQQEANLTPGAVIVYRRGTDGEWAQRVRLAAAEPAPGDAFGSAIALADGVAMIGAPGAKERAGAVYPFLFDSISRNWQQFTALQAREPQANEAFGSSVTLVSGK